VTRCEGIVYQPKLLREAPDYDGRLVGGRYRLERGARIGNRALEPVDTVGGVRT